MEGLYIAELICLLFGAYLIYKESKRANRKYLRPRIIATVVSVLSFLLLLVPIHYSVKKNNPKDEIHLLTPGASLDSLLKKDGTIITLDADFANEIEFVPDLQYYLAEHPNIHKIKIYGYGLAEEEWKSVKDYDLSFYPSPAPKGVVSCIWERELNSTEPLHVQGTYYNPDSIPVKILLHGLGSDLDSVFIKPRDRTRFSLANQPVQKGQALYELIAIAGTDTISKEPIPFQVRDEKRIRTLLLASSPNFEFKFLKNWLAENQYPVVFRARITTDKYSLDFLNTEQRSLNRIQPAILQDFDLLMVDENELANLSQAEINAIKKEVEEGMGLFIRLGESQVKSDFTKGFTLYKSLFQQNSMLELSLLGNPKFLSPLSVVPISLIKPSLDDQALILDAEANVLVTSKIYGLGKVMASTLESTYPWILEGKAKDYSLFWSSIFSNGARTRELAVTWKVFPEFPLKGQRSRILLSLDAEGGLPEIMINGTGLSPRQNIELPFQWDAYAWHEKEGWNSLVLNQQQFSFFVYNQNNWEAILANEKIQAGKAFVNDNLKLENGVHESRLEEKIVSKGWFFMTFLLAVSFLWYESRVLANK